VDDLLVLWDIDGTLLNAGGVGGDLYETVFAQLFGCSLKAFAPMAGRTDRAIILETLELAGITEPRRYVDPFIWGLSAHAPSVREAVSARGHALPGAAATLAALATARVPDTRVPDTRVQATRASGTRPTAPSVPAGAGAPGALAPGARVPGTRVPDARVLDTQVSVARPVSAARPVPAGVGGTGAGYAGPALLPERDDHADGDHGGGKHGGSGRGGSGRGGGHDGGDHGYDGPDGDHDGGDHGYDGPDRCGSPGVPGRVRQSVLTGNVRQLAEVKLAALELLHGLDLCIGAYGDDHEVRAELVHVARRRARAVHGRLPGDFAGPATVVVGDTPLDIEAALAAGARAIGVATGRHPAADLAAAGAHAVLPDLTDTQLVLETLLA
jgi:phosphoglycolate phosphatase-like HAD superfamily hydrolase